MLVFVGNLEYTSCSLTTARAYPSVYSYIATSSSVSILDRLYSVQAAFRVTKDCKLSSFDISEILVMSVSVVQNESGADQIISLFIIDIYNKFNN